MKRFSVPFISILLALPLGGLECSQDRIESLEYMNQGIALAQQDRLNEAQQAVERATQVDPSHDQAFYNLALIDIELRQYDGARQALESAIAANPQVGSYHEKLGTVLTLGETPDLERARQAFDRAIEVDPGLFKAYYKVARVHEQLEQPQQALQRYTECIEHGPRFLDCYTALGRLYADLDFDAQSVQVLQAGLEVAIDGSDEQAILYHVLGTVYQDQGEYTQATNAFRSALEIDQANPDALFSLGWTYALLDQREDAVRFLEKFLQNASDAPQHYVKAAQDKLLSLRVE